MKKNMRYIIPVLVFFFVVTLVSAGCVYYNMFFNAKKKFELAEKQSQQKAGRRKAGKFGTGYRGYEDAIEHFSKVIDRHPNSKWVDDAYYYIGLSYFRMGEYEKSQRAFREILGNYPKSKYLEEVTFWIALSRIHSGESAAGRQMLRKLAHSAEKKKWRATAWYELGELFYNDKQYDSAVVAYLTVADEYPGEESNGDARFKAGEALTLSGEGERALEQFHLILGEKPSGDLVYRTQVRMADAYFDYGQIDSGLVLLRDLAKSDVYFDSLGVLELNIGWGLEQAGNFEEAIETYENITATFPKTAWAAEAYYRIGYIQQREYFDFPAAREFYQKSKDEFSRSEYAKKAINLAVTLATIEGYQQEIATYLQGGVDSTETSDSTAADSSGMADTLGAIDTAGLVDSILETIADSAEVDDDESALLLAKAMDSSVVADTLTIPDTLVVPESYANDDSMAVSDSASSGEAIWDADSLSLPDTTGTGEDVYAEMTGTPPDTPPDTMRVNVIEHADIYSDEMPTVDTTLVIDTVQVFDTLYVLDTIMAIDAELIFALQVARDSARAVELAQNAPILDSLPSADNLPVGDSARKVDAMQPVGIISSGDTPAVMDTASSEEPARGLEVPGHLDSVVSSEIRAESDSTLNYDTSLSSNAPAMATEIDSLGLADSTLGDGLPADSALGDGLPPDSTLADGLHADSTITDKPAAPKRVVTVIDTMLFIDTLLVIDTTLIFDSEGVADAIPAADTTRAADTPIMADAIPAADTTRAADTTIMVDAIPAADTTRAADTPIMADAIPAADTTEFPDTALANENTKAADTLQVSDTTMIADNITATDSTMAIDSTMAVDFAPAVDTTRMIDTSIIIDTTVALVSIAATDSTPAFGSVLVVDTTILTDSRWVVDTTYVVDRAALTAYEKKKAAREKVATAYFKLAEACHLTLGVPDSALYYYDSLIVKFPESDLVPRALFAAGSILGDELGDSVGAATKYELVLRDYGRTDYAGAAIERLGLQGTAVDTGYPAAYFRAAERVFLEEDQPDSARVLFASIAREFPTSYYAPKAAYASIVVSDNVMTREDSSLYRLYKEYIDSFPGTPYAAAAKEILGSETSPARQQRKRGVIEQDQGTGELDSALDAIQAEQGDTTIIQYPPSPRPKVAGTFVYPESEMGIEPWRGRVVFKIWIDFTGQIAEYEMVQPSNRPDIDLAATEAVEQTIFDPDSIAPESLNMWYKYEVKVIPRAQKQDNTFNDPLYQND